MEKRLQRLKNLFGEDKLGLLASKCVLVCGLGGVGGTCLESLARSGIGNFIIVDDDKVEESNLNRQILYTKSDLDKLKVTAAKERLLSISEKISITIYPKRVDSHFLKKLSPQKIDFVIDAIDEAKSKEELLSFCLTNNIPFISSLGMANRLDPTQVRIATLNETSGDPLAKKMRLLLRNKKIDLRTIPVVFSIEKPLIKGQELASIMNVPSSAGLAMAYYSLQKLLAVSSDAIGKDSIK